MGQVGTFEFAATSPSVYFHVNLYIGIGVAVNSSCNPFIYYWRSSEVRLANAVDRYSTARRSTACSAAGRWR